MISHTTVDQFPWRESMSWRDHVKPSGATSCHGCGHALDDSALLHRRTTADFRQPCQKMFCLRQRVCVRFDERWTPPTSRRDRSPCRPLVAAAIRSCLATGGDQACRPVFGGSVEGSQRRPTSMSKPATTTEARRGIALRVCPPKSWCPAVPLEQVGQSEP